MYGLLGPRSLWTRGQKKILKSYESEVVVITEKIRMDRIKKIKHPSCPCCHGTSGHGKRYVQLLVSVAPAQIMRIEDIFICFSLYLESCFMNIFVVSFFLEKHIKYILKSRPLSCPPPMARAPLHFVFLLLWMFLFLPWVSSNEFLSSCFVSRILHLQCYERFFFSHMQNRPNFL